MGPETQVRFARSGQERDAAVARLVAEWGDPILVRGERYALADCQIVIAGPYDGLAAVSLRDRPIAELVALNAFRPREGIGTDILDFLRTNLPGCDAIRLTTTNDNIDALRFYQRRGYRLCGLRPGAVADARRVKPTIPEIGDYAIPIRDELDLMIRL